MAADRIPAFTVVIPARYASTRFPGKPLHPLNGVPMVLHAAARARESGAACVVVATDDERIARVCRDASVDVEMTREDHNSGTDRIGEVAARRQWSDDTLIVGLQGDEPATPIDYLQRLARNLARVRDADMATLCVPVRNVGEYRNPDRVKVVFDVHGMALYFSRAPIPYARDTGEREWPESFIHVGLYAYRCDYLLRYGSLPPSVAERSEQLEQLRVLHHGGRIHVDLVADGLAHGVDRPEDVPDVEAVLQARSRHSG